MPCGITFLELSFVEVNPSVWVAIVLPARQSRVEFISTVLCASVHVAVYACISHLCEETSPPD